jgi:hypothetical protein
MKSTQRAFFTIFGSASLDNLRIFSAEIVQAVAERSNGVYLICKKINDYLISIWLQRGEKKRR